MKRSRLSERQVLGILKADETSADGGRSLPRERDLGIDIFQLEVEVWRNDGGGDQAFAGARGRECEAEADVRRRFAGGQSVEGSDRKKAGDA